MFLAGGCASCHATPDQDDKTRLGGGLGLKSPFGTFYAPNISPDPNDGIGKWSEADFVTAMVKGTSPDGRASTSRRFPIPPISACGIDDVRDLFALSEDAAGGAGTSRSRTTCRFRSTSAARSAAGNSCSSTASRSSRTRQDRAPGIAAPIWSTARATAPNVIRRATSSAASSTSQRFAGGPNPDGEGWVPNITQKALERLFATRTSPSCWRPAMTPDGELSAARWPKSSRNTAQAQRRGSRRDGDLHQIAAAGRGAEAAGTEIACGRSRCPAKAGHRVVPGDHDEPGQGRSCSRPSRRCCSRCLSACVRYLGDSRCRSARWCSFAPPSRSCRCC